MPDVNMETGEVIEPGQPDEEPAAEPDEEPQEEFPFEEPEEETEAEALSFDQMSEGQQAKILDKLDREAERHVKRLQEVLQEDALMLLPCELCNPRTSGWVDLKAITDEVKQRVRIMIGDREPRKVKEDKYSRRCETCDGETVVDSGSKETSQKELPCIDCGGKGWVPVGPERLTGQPTAPVPVPTVNGVTTTGPTVFSEPTLDPELQAAIEKAKAAGYSILDPIRPVQVGPLS